MRLDEGENTAQILHQLFVPGQPVAGDEQHVLPVAAVPQTAFGLIVVRIEQPSQM